jgi:hypothetical protein
VARKYILNLTCLLAVLTVVFSGISCGRKAHSTGASSTGATTTNSATGLTLQPSASSLTTGSGSTPANPQDDREKVVQFMKGMQDAFNSFCYGIFAPGLQNELGGDLEQKDAAIGVAIGLNKVFQSRVQALTPPEGFADLAALRTDVMSANTEGRLLWVDFRTAVEAKNKEDMKTVSAKLNGFFSSPSMVACFDQTSAIMAKYSLSAEEIDYVPVSVLEKGPPEVPAS